FGFGQKETVLDELSGFEVKFSDDDRVGAAAGEKYEASVVSGVEDIIAFPDPIFVFCRGEFVEIQHDLPNRLALLEFGQAGASPKAAWILLIAPEIVVVLTMLGDIGNAFLRIEDRQQSGADGFEDSRGLEFLRAECVLLTNPAQG